MPPVKERKRRDRSFLNVEIDAAILAKLGAVAKLEQITRGELLEAILKSELQERLAKFSMASASA